MKALIVNPVREDRLKSNRIQIIFRKSHGQIMENLECHAREFVGDSVGIHEDFAFGRKLLYWNSNLEVASRIGRETMGTGRPVTHHSAFANRAGYLYYRGNVKTRQW